MCQSGTGNNKGHQTLFVRSPYEQQMRLTLKKVTVPGTQVQILGMQVKDSTAFASQEVALQGTWARQARQGYPEYYMHTYNMNDGSWGSAESPLPTVPLRTIKKNY